MQVRHIRARLTKVWDQLRTSFWFIPTTMVGAAILLAFTTIAIDEQLRFEFVENLGWLYTGDSDGARLLLSTVASSIIGIAGVTFSITIAALTMASSQFGPRLLRNFVRDVGNQCVLGTFIATFIYCLLILRTIRGSEESTFVPHISVTVGVILAIASIGVLIYFIHHVAMSIQADNVINRASNDLNTVIKQIHPLPNNNDPEQPQVPEEQSHLLSLNRRSYTVVSCTTGYIQVIDRHTLLQIAIKHNMVIEFLHCPGDFVVRDDAIAMIWVIDRKPENIDTEITNNIIIGKQRTLIQDIRFAINQVVEVGVRALSPGINDPFTAITCIDQLTAALCQIVRRQAVSTYCYDDALQLRIIFKAVQFEEIVDTAFGLLRQYGRTNTEVILRLLTSIATVVDCTSDQSQRDVLIRQATIIAHDAREGLTNRHDREIITTYYQNSFQPLTQDDYSVTDKVTTQ
ncbi:MAG: DUF2254 domain-containing protein [Chloroflexota bacterium]